MPNHKIRTPRLYYIFIIDWYRDRLPNHPLTNAALTSLLNYGRNQSRCWVNDCTCPILYFWRVSGELIQSEPFIIAPKLNFYLLAMLGLFNEIFNATCKIWSSFIEIRQRWRDAINWLFNHLTASPSLFRSLWNMEHEVIKVSLFHFAY